MARAPLEFILNHGLELSVDGVDGEGAGGVAVIGGEADIGVDVCHALGVAWGPDGGGDVDVVFLCVGGVEGALDAVAGCGLEDLIVRAWNFLFLGVRM